MPQSVWKHVYGPVKGMITSDPPSGIPPEASPYIRGIYLKDGEVNSDFGYSSFPVLGVTKSNLVNGAVLKFDQLYLLNGQSYFLALTTTNAYQYNTSTDTWDCVTKGETIEDCEDDWTAAAEVTAVAQTTYKMRGSKAVKVAIGAAFTTGVAAYENFTAIDASERTAIHFWIYSSVALTAGDYKIRLSEANAGGTGASYTDFSIPAVAATTWTAICVTGSFSALNAILSVALVVITDKGAVDIYLDDIVAVNSFSGDEDNKFSSATMNDTFICTNGVDQPQKYTGTGTFANLTTTLAAGSITTSEVVFSFKDHLVLLNNTENAADCPQRASWTNIGKTEDWTNGTAGYQDLVDDVSWVIGYALLSENEVIIYKERSLVSMRWVGGHTPFRFQTMVLGTGALSKDSIDSGTGEHLVVGPDVTYAYKGGTEIEILDDKIKKTMYGRLSREYANRLFVIFIEEDDELQIWIPTSAQVPDEVWCTNVIDENWYRKYRTMTAAGYYQEQGSITIGDLIGTIGDQNWRFGDALMKAYAPITIVGDNNGYIYQLDKTTLNNGSTAIENEFQTPDFSLPDTQDYMNKFMRVPQLIFEAAGQSVTTEYSVDSGDTWMPTQGLGGNITTLDSSYAIYQQDFDVVTRKVRFRFRNVTLSSGFKLRYFGFYWMLRSGRR